MGRQRVPFQPFDLLFIVAYGSDKVSRERYPASQTLISLMKTNFQHKHWPGDRGEPARKTKSEPTYEPTNRPTNTRYPAQDIDAHMATEGDLVECPERFGFSFANC